jgi:hypothetical protein
MILSTPRWEAQARTEIVEPMIVGSTQSYGVIMQQFAARPHQLYFAYRV